MPNRLQIKIEELHRRVLGLAVQVQKLVDLTVTALESANSADARIAFAGEGGIDEEEVRIQESAVGLLALHAPTAGDLRRVTALIKVNTELERAADCAANVAQRLQALPRDSSFMAPPDLNALARAAATALRDAGDAFDRSDADLARRVIRGDDAVDALYHRVTEAATAAIVRGADPAACLASLMIAKDLERVGDQAEHIAAEVLFVHSGEVVRHKPRAAGEAGR